MAGRPPEPCINRHGKGNWHLERKIDELKSKYILFFAGESKQPPEKEARYRKGHRNLIYGGAKTPRMDMIIQNLASRFSLYNNLWLKKLNELESGVSRQQKKKNAPPPSPSKKEKPSEISLNLNDENSFEALYTAYRELLPTSGKTAERQNHRQHKNQDADPQPGRSQGQRGHTKRQAEHQDQKVNKKSRPAISTPLKSMGVQIALDLAGGGFLKRFLVFDEARDLGKSGKLRVDGSFSRDSNPSIYSSFCCWLSPGFLVDQVIIQINPSFQRPFPQSPAIRPHACRN